MVSELIRCGWEVHVAAPNLAEFPDTLARLGAMGAKCHEISLNRTGMSPIDDLKSLLSTILVTRKIRPDKVFTYTIKPVIYGSIAARLTGVPSAYAMITGLGYAFIGKARGRKAIVRFVARNLYRLALSGLDKVFFQTTDDLELFREFGILTDQASVSIIDGSGVDVEYFRPAPLPKGKVAFILVSRLIGEKGVRDYVSAAALVKQSYPDTIFHLVGGLDSNPDGISKNEVVEWQNDGLVVWHGEVSDVRPFIEDAHVYVLASHREGIPRAALEAMAMGRAVIATNAPGAKEVVEKDQNGLLVPVQDTKGLSEAMMQLVENPKLVIPMGKRSIEIANGRFELKTVTKDLLRKMGIKP